MSEEAVTSGPVTVEHEGWTVDSSGSGQTAESLAQSLKDRDHQKAVREAKARGEQPPDPPKTDEEKASEAARELGKKGGEAAAKAKKAAAKKAAKESEKAEEDSEDEEKVEASEEDEDDEGEKARKKLAEDLEKAKPHEKRKLASERVKEATQEAAQYKRELQALRRELEARTAAPPQPPTPPPDKSKYEGRDDEYIQAQIQHGIQKALAEREQHQRQSASEAKFQSFREDRDRVWAESVKEVAQDDPKYLERLAPEIADAQPWYMLPKNQPPGPENFVAAEIDMSESPARLALHLSENPDIYQRLVALQAPRLITREVARIEREMEAPAAPTGTPAKPPSVSQAPPPPSPVRGAPPAAESGYRPGMSFDEYLKTQKLGKELLSRTRR